MVFLNIFVIWKLYKQILNDNIVIKNKYLKILKRDVIISNKYCSYSPPKKKKKTTIQHMSDSGPPLNSEEQ